MNVHTTSRRLLLPPELKAQIEERLADIGRRVDASAEADVILAEEKNRRRIEIQIRSRRDRVMVVEEGRDWPAVINEALNILDQKLKKEREKFREKKRRSARVRRSPAAALETVPLPPRVVRLDHYAAKPLSFSDALVEFNLRKKEVLMFRTEDEDRWAVLFRRKDGSYGLVCPE